MKNKLLSKKIKNFLTGAFLVAGFFVFFGNASAQTAPKKWQVFSYNNSGNFAPNLPTDSGHSLNWAGYVAAKGTYTSISGSWTIPQIQMSASTSADSTWIGIGGIKSGDLIQVGTQTVKNYYGKDFYQAWFELLPQGTQIIPVSVNPNDSISVTINEVATDEWNIYFKNNTSGLYYSTVVNYKSSLLSAEWIEEMPTEASSSSLMPLDDFGSIQFTGAYTEQNSTNFNLEQAGASIITMVNSLNQVIASPSILGNDGASFAVVKSNNN